MCLGRLLGLVLLLLLLLLGEAGAGARCRSLGFVVVLGFVEGVDVVLRAAVVGFFAAVDGEDGDEGSDPSS